MIALVIALFLLWGLGTMVAGTRQTGSNQMLLAHCRTAAPGHVLAQRRDSSARAYF